MFGLFSQFGVTLSTSLFALMSYLMKASPAAEKVTENLDLLLFAYTYASAFDGKERALIDVHLRPPGRSLRPVRRSLLEQFLKHKYRAAVLFK